MNTIKKTHRSVAAIQLNDSIFPVWHDDNSQFRHSDANQKLPENWQEAMNPWNLLLSIESK